MKLMLILLLILFQACSLIKQTPEQTVSVKDFNLKVTKEVLANGLIVLIVENDKLPIFSYYTFFKVGAKHESKGIVGGTHFLEHMMFKGAKKYGAKDFDRIIESNGGNTNAFTNSDLTVYYDDLPSSSLETLVDLEADRMQGILLEPESFEKEREVILEERKMRYENKPDGMLYLAMSKEAFKGTPYGRSVIGEDKEIREITRERMLEHYNSFYAPNNAILVIAGGIEANKALSLVRKYYGSIKPFVDLEKIKKKLDVDRDYKLHNKFGSTIKINGQSPVPKFFYVFKGEKLGTRKSQILDILSYVIGVGDSSYLVQKYVKNRYPKMSNIYASSLSKKNAGLFVIGGDLLRGANLKRLEKKLRGDFKKNCRKVIDERAIQKTKNQFWISFYDQLETNSGMAKYVGMAEALMGDYKFNTTEIEVYESITTEEVVAACEELFTKGKGTFLSIWNKHPKKTK